MIGRTKISNDLCVQQKLRTRPGLIFDEGNAVMDGVMRMSFFVMTVGICLAACAPITAQEFSTFTRETTERDSTYYSEPAYKPNPRQIVQEKAQARAYQRQARLASMSWYGMSNSRPQAATTPFTSRYSPTWEMPGGRPYSWHPTYRWPGYGTFVR